MNTTIAVLLAALILIGAAAAYAGPGMMGNFAGGRLEQIVEDGTFADLQQYRQATGSDVMPWVRDEATFAAMRTQHEAMEQYWTQRARMPGSGYGGYGCPMMGGW